jgi:hypothetical protein
VLRVTDLTPPEQQALAVQRSRVTGFPRWLELLKAQRDAARNSRDQDSLEGLLLRLEAFTMGGMARIYGPGPDTVAVEDLGLLGDDAWGLSILEGGAELEDYAKSVILGLVAWHLYTDAVARRRERVNHGDDARLTQLYFEEANKILTGVDTGLSDGRGLAATSSLFQTMWRDGRKYRSRLMVGWIIFYFFNMIKTL